NSKQDGNEKKTDLWALESEKVRRKFFQELIFPEKIPLRLDPGIRGCERIGFFAELPIHSGNARPVGKKDGEAQQNDEAAEPEENVAERKARKKFHPARSDFFSERRRHSLALDNEQVQPDQA